LSVKPVHKVLLEVRVRQASKALRVSVEKQGRKDKPEVRVKQDLKVRPALKGLPVRKGTQVSRVTPAPRDRQAYKESPGLGRLGCRERPESKASLDLKARQVP
jgi:hypothetical protein